MAQTQHANFKLQTSKHASLAFLTNLIVGKSHKIDNAPRKLVKYCTVEKNLG